MKKIISAALLCIIIFSLFSCSRTNDFTHAEYTITLPGDYYRTASNGVAGDFEYDLVMTNGEAYVGVSRLSFVVASQTGIDITLTPGDYAEYCMALSGTDSVVKQHADVYYYVCYQMQGAEKYMLLLAFHRSPNAYFTTVFTVRADAERRYISEFLDYADSVKFKF